MRYLKRFNEDIEYEESDTVKHWKKVCHDINKEYGDRFHVTVRESIYVDINYKCKDITSTRHSTIFIGVFEFATYTSKNRLRLFKGESLSDYGPHAAPTINGMHQSILIGDNLEEDFEKFVHAWYELKDSI